VNEVLIIPSKNYTHRHSGRGVWRRAQQQQQQQQLRVDVTVMRASNVINTSSNVHSDSTGLVPAQLHGQVRCWP